MKKFLECGKIINKRGISGELKIECYCDSTSSINNAKVLYTDEDGKQPYDVISIKGYRGFLYIKLSGIDSAEKADSMRNKLLYVSREDVIKSDESVFIADLIGLNVIDADTAAVYGKISDVSNYGASDIYTVKTKSGSVMIPAVKDIVIKIDTASGVYIRPIKGLFDEAEEIR
ncbi:MAG: 16S rRNA processing protein RimM [Clostridia bacterium]|nr:16S rRNA processing protein RimM [Clostridia bacterium]